MIEAFCIHGTPRRLPCARCGPHQHWLTPEQVAAMYPGAARTGWGDPELIRLQREENARLTAVIRAMPLRALGEARAITDELLGKPGKELSATAIQARAEQSATDYFRAQQAEILMQRAKAMLDVLAEAHAERVIPLRTRARWWWQDLAYRARRWWRRRFA